MWSFQIPEHVMLFRWLSGCITSFDLNFFTQSKPQTAALGENLQQFSTLMRCVHVLMSFFLLLGIFHLLQHSILGVYFFFTFFSWNQLFFLGGVIWFFFFTPSKGVRKMAHLSKFWATVLRSTTSRRKKNINARPILESMGINDT